MINAALGMWGGAPAIDYLAGNAWDLDGSFDYATILEIPTPSSFIDVTTAFSINLNFNPTTVGGQPRVIYSVGDAFSSGGKGFAIFKGSSPPYIGIIVNNGSASPLQMRAVNINDTVPNSVVIQKAAGDIFSTATIDFWINGVLETTSILSGTNVTTTITAYDSNHRIGARPNNKFKFFGSIKILEIINRIATADEIADANTNGSFRGAGVSFDSGSYLLAVDFDKTNGQNPTTFATTPTYTISGIGGTTYGQYIP